MNKMEAYINGIGMISPQHSTGDSGFLNDIVEHNVDFLRCLDFNYKAYIDPLSARRMSRLIKMGITSARICLEESGVTMPDAIITGTSLGSVEDTEKILDSLRHGEQLLNPTPFIQSTYNTISSQIAIHLKCTNYNSTYVHRIFSFESGLMDALLQLDEGTATNLLVGGIDEMTLNHLTIIRGLGYWKLLPESNLELLRYASHGVLAGEGSGFFLLSSKKQESTYAKLAGVATFYKPKGVEGVETKIKSFLGSMNLALDDVDIFLAGISGDRDSDELYYSISNSLFQNTTLAYFKHLCGDYNTASAFGLWVASNIIKHQYVPQILLVKGEAPEKTRNILLYNQLKGVNHALMLISLPA